MTRKERLKRGKRVNALRLILLIIILAVVTAFGIIHQLSTTWRPVGVDALCPFGGIESLVTLITTGAMLEKIAASSFVLLGATILAAVFFRRTFCGTICPLGTIQELFARLGKAVMKQRLRVPRKADQVLRYLKYLVLVVFVVLSIVLGTLAIRPYDPWATYMHLASNEVFTVFLVGFIVLLITAIGSFFYDRFFCKYLCPMGGFLGAIRNIGIFRVKRNDETCIHCSLCSKVCPVNIDVEKLDQVKTAECISCIRCVNICPVEDTLYVGGPKKGKVSPAAAILIPVAIFSAVVAITSFTGQFDWTVKAIEERALINGSFDPAEIKGSDTFAAVAEISRIPKKAFVEQFGLTDGQFEGMIKEWAHNPDDPHETEEVRDFVAEYMKK